jgi:type III secretory pathway component EscV
MPNKPDSPLTVACVGLLLSSIFIGSLLLIILHTNEAMFISGVVILLVMLMAGFCFGTEFVKLCICWPCLTFELCRKPEENV